MERVAEREQLYKQIALQLDPDYGEILKYIEFVKQFISDNDGVIYGGTAIDYALRLRGDSIYDDEALTVPDLDFYMADSVGGSRKLADILYHEGAVNARSFVAMHVETMRVDSGNNHFIADISYHPADMLAKVPTVTYSGMKCVHPDYQRSDLHSALTFPFDNAPREVIFDRWKKDIMRLNKIDAAYPIELTDANVSALEAPLTETHKMPKQPLYGWAAYCALVRGRGKRVPASMRIARNALTFNTLNGLEVVTCDIDTLGDAKRHYPYSNLVFERYTGAAGATVYYSTENRLISTVTVDIGGIKIETVCAQGILHYMIGMWFYTGSVVYLAAYSDLWDLVKSSAGDCLKLSLKTYGSQNNNHAQLMQIRRIAEGNISGLPAGYFPSKGIEPIEFHYDSEYYQIDGRPAE